LPFYHQNNGLKQGQTVQKLLTIIIIHCGDLHFKKIGILFEIMKRSLQNNSKLLYLLEGHPNFIKSIKEAREYLGIPSYGFLDEEEVGSWYEESVAMTDNYFQSKSYANHIKVLQEKEKSKELTMKMKNESIKLLLSLKLRVNELNDFCNYIVQTFNLPTNLKEPIRNYIFYNKFGMIPVNNFTVTPPTKDDRRISINIYSDLTKRESKDLINFLKLFKTKLPKIRKIDDSLIEDLSFENWKSTRGGYTSEDWITAKDMAEEYLKSNKKTQRVYDAERKIAKNRKKFFG
jgi:hypothetical protein